MYTSEILGREINLRDGKSFAQGVIVDHAPLTIVANYAGARLWTMKSVVLIKKKKKKIC